MTGTTLLVFAIVAAFPLAAQQMPENKKITDPIVARFAVAGIPAIQALLQLSRSEHATFGIVANEMLCKTQVSYSTENTPASVIAKQIVALVPGYTWKIIPDLQGAVVEPISVNPAAEQFLGLVDSHYGPVKGNLQTLVMTLWVHARYILHPDQGTAGSILGSTNEPVLEVEAENATIEEILDRIALKSKGAWVLRPLPPSLASLGGEIPFSIISESGSSLFDPGTLCTPLGEVGP